MMCEHCNQRETQSISLRNALSNVYINPRPLCDVHAELELKYVNDRRQFLRGED